MILQGMLSSALQQKSARRDVPLPPTSIEGWLQKQRIAYQDWPAVPNRSEEQGFAEVLGLTPFTKFEAVEKDLSSHAGFEEQLYSQLEQQVAGLSSRVNRLGSHVYQLEETREEEVVAKGSDPFITEDTSSESGSSEDESLTVSQDTITKNQLGSKERVGRKPVRQVRGQRGHRGGNKSEKRAEDAIFMGFDEKELTPLPGQVEPIRVLDFVSKNQGFSAAFMKSWRKMFYSDPSSAVLQDMFWVMWLDKFNAESDIEPDTGFKFLFRCSLSYVQLFQRVPAKFRDLFFLKYADCLAQSLYVAFWALFPGSRPEFEDTFRRYTTTLIYTVIVGIEPLPLSWNEWRIDPSEFSGSKIQKQDSRNDISKLPVIKPATPSPEKQSSHTDKEPLLPYGSNSLGMSPIYHNVKFNVLGQSPLVKCYLSSMGTNSSRRPSYMNRAEILAVPKPMESYRQVMENIRRETKERELELDKLVKSLDLDVKRNWKECRREMQQFHTEDVKNKPNPRNYKPPPE